MIGQSRYRGFLSIDALLSAIPAILIAMALSWTSSELLAKAESHSSDQQAFGKVASAADHIVKIGAVVREGQVRYPNWIDPSLITGRDTESLREALGLESLYVSMEPPGGAYRFCIYRLVVIGKDRTISKLYVCGG